jgi:D-arabinose 1-dehydrogenase-like Zn-dependent alcohol dehydrogenase
VTTLPRPELHNHTNHHGMQARNEWASSTYPLVPGHEIVGVVTEVGADVTKFKVGDRAGVGCLVDSCRTCTYCKDAGEEQYCNAYIMTYNSKDKWVCELSVATCTLTAPAHCDAYWSSNAGCFRVLLSWCKLCNK